jgi:hypothetical protein
MPQITKGTAFTGLSILIIVSPSLTFISIDLASSSANKSGLKTDVNMPEYCEVSFDIIVYKLQG